MKAIALVQAISQIVAQHGDVPVYVLTIHSRGNDILSFEDPVDEVVFHDDKLEQGDKLGDAAVPRILVT